jgi:hypothetical protein
MDAEVDIEIADRRKRRRAHPHGARADTFEDTERRVCALFCQDA